LLKYLFELIKNNNFQLFSSEESIIIKNELRNACRHVTDQQASGFHLARVETRTSQITEKQDNGGRFGVKTQCKSACLAIFWPIYINVNKCQFI